MRMTAPSGTSAINVAGSYFPVDEDGFITIPTDLPIEQIGMLYHAGFRAVAETETPAEAIAVDHIEADAAALDAQSIPAVEPEA